TCFKSKGRLAQDKTIRKQKKQLQQILGKQRATRLEGSFGNKKNHYLLDKIKAKTFFTEIAWIFFGNLTANAIAITKRAKPPP
ncbi:MAG: transposase, partial [Bacteroidota bacterium]